MLYQLSSLVMYFPDIKYLDLELIFTSLVYCWLGFIAGLREHTYLSLVFFPVRAQCSSSTFSAQSDSYVQIVEPTLIFHPLEKSILYFTLLLILQIPSLQELQRHCPFIIEYFHSLNSSLLYLLSPPPTQLWQSMDSFSIT